MKVWVVVSCLLSLTLFQGYPLTANNTMFSPFDKTLEIQLPENFIVEKSNEDVQRYDVLKHSFYFSPESDIDYVIITASVFYNTLKNNYLQWKINTDDKVNSILIVNVSDIVNDPDCWVTGKYGDGTNESNGNPWVKDGEEISNELFNDTQAKIRNYIRKCVSEYNTKYILLVGDKNYIPPRMMCSYAHSGPNGTWYNVTSHAVDMYYACLDGNFNNNTNTKWGENRFGDSVDWAKVPEWDNIDWYYDVLVGRVLISTIQGLNNWINKTKNYVESNEKTYLMSGIIATKDINNNIDDYVWTQIGDEFPKNISFVNNQNITQTQWNILDDYCNGIIDRAGISLLYHSGHGGTLWTPYNPTNLNNSLIPNFLYTEGCDSADFGVTTESRMEQWMEDDGGIFAGIGNSAYGWFIASTWYSEEMFNIMFNTSSERCFAKAHYLSREHVGWTLHSVAPMIYKETNFFGDPALEFHFYNPPPMFMNESPTNNTMNIPINLTWNITVTDDNIFDLNISCNNGQWTYYSNATNGVYNISLTNLYYSTWYTITTYATDGTSENTSTYHFRTRPETYPEWDITMDGECNYLDISSLVSHYLETGTPGWIRDDINKDGIINYLDTSFLTSNYGETY